MTKHELIVSCFLLQETMADDFDIEAMLEAPYRKVGRIARLVFLFFCAFTIC